MASRGALFAVAVSNAIAVVNTVAVPDAIAVVISVAVIVAVAVIIAITVADTICGQAVHTNGTVWIAIGSRSDPTVGGIIRGNNRGAVIAVKNTVAIVITVAVINSVTV